MYRRLLHRPIHPISSSVRLYASLPESLHKRVIDSPMEATYNPLQVEEGWQSWWQEHRASPDAKKHFTMLLPPPNITGALHIGHALTATIQDAVARWHRMRGFDVRWIPGLDHAGIATQSVVEKKLWSQKKLTRHDIGREAFLKQVEAWYDTYGSRILAQLDRLGAVLNHDHKFFTLDPPRSKAVIDAFVRLYEKGLIYRNRRMVNWCPTLQTAISDIEVDSVSLTKRTMLTLPGRTQPVEFGVMYRILYKVADEENMFVQVDTTRPETILGDVAVAIHPDDERYKHLHNKFVLHPFSNEQLPIVLDAELVNPELGTGVVKITPAHDANDFACGQRHGLTEPTVIDLHGKMITDIPELSGLDRFDARMKIIELLEAKNLFVETNDHPTSVSLCSRSGNVIEPYLMPQWFVKCDSMAKTSADAVRSGELPVIPALQHKQTWYHFLDNIQDWCISRQLWWGHRIPAYKVVVPGQSDEKWVVGRTEEEAMASALSKWKLVPGTFTLHQDEDVLDTWFSSALLPLSGLEWPSKDEVPESIKQQYPLNIMETGSDILFFWVARMSMLCTELSGGTQPFKSIWLHPMVRDKTGRKMSKSLGNVIDPLHVISGIELPLLLEGLQQGNLDPKEHKRAEKDLKKEFPKGIPACGTDALRLTLASYLSQGRQINMDVQRVIAHRHFCNKMWNAIRYALPLLATESTSPLDRSSMSLADRWILSRMAEAVSKVNEGYKDFKLASSAMAAQTFFIQELCDVYIEFSKPILYTKESTLSKQAAQKSLALALDTSLRLFHPIMPYVTEELWQRLQHTTGKNISSSLMVASFPEACDVAKWIDQEAEANMKVVLDVMHCVRSLKHTRKTLAPDASNESGFVIQCDENEWLDLMHQNLNDIEVQCRAGPVKLSKAFNDSEFYLTHSLSPTCQVLMPLPVSLETSGRLITEINRLQKHLSKATSTIVMLETKKQDPNYSSNVPEAIQIQDYERLTQAQVDAGSLQDSIHTLKMLHTQLQAETRY
ncbi:valyl-tRNA synthetase [Thraustotheca clavata]|uniref:valine--tRNA ligase n=1 Tax=Thraustotheca clavata TaxID=74557 RepID=A0A1W0A9F9_9STRA|nr:valyl-tRNA synthetase [Thraustotheca clavata]